MVRLNDSMTYQLDAYKTLNTSLSSSHTGSISYAQNLIEADHKASISYEINYHLGNVRAVVHYDAGNNEVAFTSAADYYPFGMPFLNSQSPDNYRHGYQGQFAEKDEETGYNQFEARLYDARIGRWLATDPAGQYHSPYMAMGNSPLIGVDPDGQRNVYYNADGTYHHTEKNNFFHNIFFGNRHYIENQDNDGYTLVDTETFFAWQDINPKGWGANDDLMSRTNPFTERSIFNGFTNFTGANNVKNYYGEDDYNARLITSVDIPSYFHDLDYKILGIDGLNGLYNDQRAIAADILFVHRKYQFANFNIRKGKSIEGMFNFAVGTGLGLFATPKTIRLIYKEGFHGALSQIGYWHSRTTKYP